MRGIVAEWIKRLTSRSHSERRVIVDDANAADRAVARGLARELDRMMRLGLMEQADRIAATAMRIAGVHPPLAERIARLRLASDDPQRALDMIDACRVRTSSLRLLRNVALIQLGRRAEAHADLNAWASRSTAPLDARLLLALFEWEDDRVSEAISALVRNIRQMPHEPSLQVMTLLTAARDNHRQATAWARRLRKASACRPMSNRHEVLLQSLGIEFDRSEHIRIPAARIRTLAQELAMCEPAITALASAQQRRPDGPTIHVLRQAITLAMPELTQRAAAYEAAARLARLDSDMEAARAAVAEGLREQPMSASLAILQAELSDHPPHSPAGELAA